MQDDRWVNVWAKCAVRSSWVQRLDGYVHERMVAEGICARCGAEAHRDDVDVGVGVIYGPWGCSCGWSEAPEYDLLFSGGTQADGSYLDPYGGLYPVDNPVVQMMREHDDA